MCRLTSSAFGFRLSAFRFEPRAGLAPLELVLAMPLLMMVMALMIIFGNAAYWKVRGLSVARNAAWSNRWPRTGFNEPTPQPWRPGQYARRGAADIDVLDDPQLQHPVVRGPLPGGFDVNEELLDPSRGVTEGHAQAKLEPAMMPALKPFEYKLEQALVDDKFQYPQMGIPANVHRRIPFIYELPRADAAVSQAWVSATLAVMNSPLKPDLAPLDHDAEIFAHYGYYPDFHPGLSRFCSLDLQSAWENQTRRLIGRIKGRQRPRVAGVPERMASFWISMYQSQIDDWESRIADLENQIQQLDPVADAARIAQLQQEIQALQAQINALQPEVGVLRDFRNRVRQRPNTPDGPVPPLATLSAGAGNLVWDLHVPANRGPHEPPLRPIPAALLSLMSPAETACCGQEPPINELLRLLEADPDGEELLP